MMIRAARPCLFLLLALGCDGPVTTASDAGPAAIADAWAQDASTVLACGGLATVCGTLTTEADCLGVEGCAFSQCGGFAIACAERLSMAMCGTGLGCSWDGAACSGTANPCGTLMMDTCPMQVGCAWSAGMPRCRGMATRCEMLSADSCVSQPGCRTCDDFGCRVPLGLPCADDVACNMPWGGVCLTGFPDGYCSPPCTAAGTCPAAATCIDLGPDGMHCLGNCATAADCRSGYECTMVSATVSVCTGPQ